MTAAADSNRPLVVMLCGDRSSHTVTHLFVDTSMEAR